MNDASLLTENSQFLRDTAAQLQEALRIFMEPIFEPEKSIKSEQSKKSKKSHSKRRVDDNEEYDDFDEFLDSDEFAQFDHEIPDILKIDKLMQVTLLDHFVQAFIPEAILELIQKNDENMKKIESLEYDIKAILAELRGFKSDKNEKDPFFHPSKEVKKCQK